MTNKHMRYYWQGYRAAKAAAYACGIQAAREEYRYGLSGKNRAYCDGYRRFITTKLERN